MSEVSPTKIAISAKELQLLGSKNFDPVYFHGETMLPFLREADELIITPVNPTEIKLGDIVTYLDDDKFPTRRVIRDLKSKHSFLIQGDTSSKIKAVVPYDSVAGKAIGRKRNGKWIYQNNLRWKWAASQIVTREWIKRKLKKIFSNLATGL